MGSSSNRIAIYCPRCGAHQFVESYHWICGKCGYTAGDKVINPTPKRPESVRIWIETWQALRDTEAGQEPAGLSWDLLAYIEALEAAVRE
jgi:ribosomal protein L37E